MKEKVFLHKTRKQTNIFIYLKGKNKYILKSKLLGIDKEYKNLNFLKKENFSFIPKTSLKKIKGTKFLVQNFIRSSQFKYTPEKLSLLAKTIGLFIIFRKYFKEYLYFRKCKKFLKSLLQKEIFKKKIKYSFICGNLSKDNILFEKRKLYIIDWEKAEFGNPAYDLTSLSENKNFSEILFLKFYKKYVNIDEEFLERVRFYKILQLSVITSYYRFNFLNEIIPFYLHAFLIRRLNRIEKNDRWN